MDMRLGLTGLILYSLVNELSLWDIGACKPTEMYAYIYIYWEKNACTIYIRRVCSVMSIHWFLLNILLHSNFKMITSQLECVVQIQYLVFLNAGQKLCLNSCKPGKWNWVVKSINVKYFYNTWIQSCKTVHCHYLVILILYRNNMPQNASWDTGWREDWAVVHVLIFA